MPPANFSSSPWQREPWPRSRLSPACSSGGGSPTCERSWSVWTLGRHFRRDVTIEADQRVITAGPYRWVRHPAYAGNLLTYGGLGLALGSWVSAAVVLTVAFVGLLPRIKLEERTLEQAFGSAYVDYERATARL